MINFYEIYKAERIEQKKSNLINRVKGIKDESSFALAMITSFVHSSPSAFFNEQLKNGNLEKYFPEFYACVDCKQDPCFHEETVYEHTLRALDYHSKNYYGLSTFRDELVSCLAILYHDIGKPNCRVEINASSMPQSQEKTDHG